MNWPEAILKCIDSLGGTAHCQDIYLNIGRYAHLTEKHLQATVYGGRPAYQHEVRSYLSNLAQEGALVSPKRGIYKITAMGKSRIA